jgi:hypothetical protein
MGKHLALTSRAFQFFKSAQTDEVSVLEEPVQHEKNDQAGGQLEQGAEPAGCRFFRNRVRLGQLRRHGGVSIHYDVFLGIVPCRVFALSGIFYDGIDMKSIAVSFISALALAGCARINDTTMQLLSTSSPALAVVNDTALTGNVVLFSDRTGTLSLESDAEPPLKCMGHLRFTASETGVVNLKCSDGTDALMTFIAIRETRGHGSGKTARGMARFTFGFDAAEAAAYLRLPADKRPGATPEAAARPQ